MNNFQSRPSSEIQAIQAAMAKRYGYSPLPEKEGFGRYYANGRSFYTIFGQREIFENEQGQKVWAKRAIYAEPATNKLFLCYGEVTIVMDAKLGNQLMCKGYIGDELAYSQSWRYVMKARYIGEESSPETALGLVMNGLEDKVKKG